MTRTEPDRTRPAATELDTLARCSAAELQTALAAAGVPAAPHRSRAELLAAWLTHRLGSGDDVVAEGALELLPEGFGFVRSPHFDYEPSVHDPFVSPSQARALNLKSGHWLAGPLRAPRGSERYFAFTRIDRVNGAAPAALAQRVLFAARTPVLATRPLTIGGDDPALRVLARLTPWCRGHRVLVTAPATWPATAWLAGLARALHAGGSTEPPLLLLCALDQRPEDLAAARVTTADLPGCETVGTTFDQPPERHAALAELVLQRATRLVEAGHDVVVLLDSLTALAHATQRATPPSGRWLGPGLDAHAVLPGKRLFAAARACAEGGSLTVIATAVRPADAASVEHTILAQYTHRANADVDVDVALAAAGLPAPFAPTTTRTRREDDARDHTTLAAVHSLRERLAAAATRDARERLLAALDPA